MFKFRLLIGIIFYLSIFTIYTGCASDAASSLPAVDNQSYTDADTDTDSDADGDIDLLAYSYIDTDANGEIDEIIDVDSDGEVMGVNPFVYTAFDPFSTFATDVDTASYNIFRQYLASELLIEPSKVRLEEFVNFFKYDYHYPDASAEEPFSISLDTAPGIFYEDTRILRIGIQAKKLPEDYKKPANIVFLVDVSGSMDSSDKLPLVKYTLKKSLDFLTEGDTVSIVSYSSQTSVRLKPADVVSGREDIIDVIDSLYASGSTNGSDGIKLAYEQAEAGMIEGGINHVILCTDGDFNFNITGTDDLVSLIEKERDKGITLTALGYGMSSNDEMMEAVSNAGDGVYTVLADKNQADEFILNKMLGSLMYVAKDVKIQVEFNPEYVLAYRLLGYENRAISDEDFRNDSVDGGEVGYEHQVTALYQIIPNDSTVPVVLGAPVAIDGTPYDGEREIKADEAALVKIRYKNPEATTDDPAFEVVKTIVPDDINGDLENADSDMLWALGVASFSEILKQSPYASKSNIDAFTAILKANTKELKEREEFVTLVNKAVLLLDKK
ncbi:MAG: von Willebrand factor type A domain-containing protein [Deltaproteobacteria bacterium]|nr:von Willebrand factor type A domain-containing protein [Deltaproteobacteria bacterium]